MLAFILRIYQTKLGNKRSNLLFNQILTGIFVVFVSCAIYLCDVMNNSEKIEKPYANQVVVVAHFSMRATRLKLGVPVSSSDESPPRFNFWLNTKRGLFRSATRLRYLIICFLMEK